MKINLTNNRFFLPVTTFIVGAAVMAIEMTASRVLAPQFGASFFVWTALIVTVLLSMSLGYWFGGRYAARVATAYEALGLLLVSAAAMLLAGVWCSHSFGLSLPVVLSDLGGPVIALFLGSLFMSIVAFSLPVFMLAMIGPLLLRLWSERGGDVSAASGRYFAVSTAGSVFGTLLPTLVLVPQFGVQLTIMSIAVVLILLGWPMLRGKIKLFSAVIIVIMFGLLLVRGESHSGAVVYQNDSPYQLIRVLQNNIGDRFLIFNEGSGVQSVYYPNRTKTDSYFDYIAAVPWLVHDVAPAPRLALIGVAGGTLVRQYLTALPKDAKPDITGVEVDPQVIKTARRFFALDELPLRVVNEDGRMFLAGNKDPFNIIFIDAYSTELYIPSHLVTAEFFQLVRKNLSAGGMAVMNVNAPERDSALLKAITNTVSSVFPYVYVAKAGDTWNWLVYATDHEVDFRGAVKNLPADYSDVALATAAATRVSFDQQSQILSDDRAPIEFMTDRMVLADALKNMGRK